MWIVRLALRRPYTFIVLAVLIVLLGLFTIVRTPTDIFPNINIPIVATIWRYTGLPPDGHGESRSPPTCERTAQTTVNDVEHTESQSLSGHVGDQVLLPAESAGADGVCADHRRLADAAAPGAAGHQRRRSCSPITPRSVPILQLTLDSPSASEAQLFDSANSVVRTGLAPVAGAADALSVRRQAASGAGGSGSRCAARQGAVGRRCQQRDRRAEPDHSGGHRENRGHRIQREAQASPADPRELNDVPIRTVNGTVVFVRDVAHVHDGAAPQTNLVRVDGRHSVTDVGAQDRQRLDAADHRADQGAAAPIQGAAAARRQRQLRSAISRCSCAPRSTA